MHKSPDFFPFKYTSECCFECGAAATSAARKLSNAVILKLLLNLRKTYSDRNHSVDEGAHRCFVIGFVMASDPTYFCDPASNGDVGVKAKEKPGKN